MSTTDINKKPDATMLLWPNGAPGALGERDEDRPSLTPHWPSHHSSGAAMVVCPGGGYGALAGHEGNDYARWLADHGIACFVLKYRLGSSGYRHPIMMHDVQRAIRIVRASAKPWNIDPQRIGVMGSSAGGHLAATAATHFGPGNPASEDPIERVSSRPDAVVLCYPVITMGRHTHEGSKGNLLGNSPSAELVDLMSTELQVTKQTPPCFIWHTEEDAGVRVENAMDFAAALRKNGVPFDLHIYQKGAHGLGLGVSNYDASKAPQMHPWTSNLLVWLRVQKMII